MTSDHKSRLTLRAARLQDGSTVDVDIDDGVITKVSPASDNAATGETPGIRTEIDLGGYLLLPAPVEPHAHLDKALLGNRVVNESNDLVGAIDAIHEAYESMTEDDVGRRGLASVAEAVAHGYTAIRTHADCGVGIGNRSVVALVRLRERLRGLVDLQVVALSRDVVGPTGAQNREILASSMAAGADLVGGCPSLESDSLQSLTEFFAIAEEFGRGLDLHVDETMDAGILALRELADRVIETNFGLPVTASHCVSLGAQSARIAEEVARVVAEAGVSVVTLPQTNLFLQGRVETTMKPRGLTAIHELRAAGVTVAGGGDNWQDPFNPMGRIDALETASLLVSAGHLTPTDAYESVSSQARLVMGLPPVDIAAGHPADLMAIAASSLHEAVAAGSEQRIVFKAGRIVARTRVNRELDPRLATAR